MANLSELVRRHTTLRMREIDHLHRLVASWGLLSDLGFSDLLLFVETAESANGDDLEGAGQSRFVVVAQVRPTTSQTLYWTDWVGAVTDGSERPLVARSLNGEVLEGDIELSFLRTEALVTSIPIRCGDEIIGVVSRERARSTAEPSEIQQTYEKVFNRFAAMITDGTFPFVGQELEIEVEPRVGDGVMVIDEAGLVEFTSPNAVSALHRIGIHTNPLGRRVVELNVHDRVLAASLRTGTAIIHEIETGDRGAVLFNCLPMIQRGRTTGALVLLRDVSELRHRDRQLMSKDATIREIHHRVKNNLQTISALLRIQSRRVDAPEAKAALSESVRRIGSIALVHEILAREAGDAVPFADIMRPLVRTVEDSLVSPEQPVRFRVAGDRITLPAMIATPLAVVLTELMQNAVDHAYPAESGPYGGEAEIDIRVEGEMLKVWVRDDGVGPAEDFSLENADGLGLSIVRTLISSELRGEIEFRPRELDGPNGGTEVVLTIPLPAEDDEDRLSA